MEMVKDCMMCYFWKRNGKLPHNLKSRKEEQESFNTIRESDL